MRRTDLNTFWKGLALVGLCVAFCSAGLTQTAAPRIVLGKLGQTLKSTSIYATTSTRSRVYYKPKPYEYIVIRSTKSEAWYGVLLANGRIGYIRTEAVASLPYEVTADRPGGSRPGTTQVASRSGNSLASYSLNFVGTPYKWGGNDPWKGIDCSAFVKFLYGQVGVNLPRTAAEQALVGQPIRRLEELRQGDRLYFWDSKRGKIGHTGMYIGNGYFVHSSSGKGGVTTDYLGQQKWLKILIAARR
jgi:cell wall-associated NlpC family hydrolase